LPLFSLAFLLRAALSTLPVFLFLGALVLIDSYKLVRLRTVLFSIAAGALAAGVAYLANSGLLNAVAMDIKLFARYVSPVIEEVVKGLYVVYLIRRARVGFVVDAAIHGFAVGAGFAVIENIYYLNALPDVTIWTWVIRGFGTAVMHGGTTAIFGMISRTLYDRAESPRVRVFLPGLGIVIGLHSLFNHFLLPPLLSTVVLLLVLPGCMALVFQQSEKSTRHWLGAGFDSDQELLALIHSGQVAGTRVGRYLQALKTRFPGPVVVDMLCLLRLHVELSIRAKGVLMLRERGFRVSPDPNLRAKFDELRYLEKSISPTGMLAIAPFLHTSSRDLWQRNMLSEI